jgi:hypothetical protein
MRIRTWLMLVFASLAVLPAAPRATVLLPAEFREIVGGSDVIAYGRVVDKVAARSDDRKRIDTLITFQVGTYLKGGPGDTLVIQVPGGEIGRYRNVMVGAPSFDVGDEAVLFLTVRPGARPTIFGLNQGVFRVRFDGQTKQRMVVRPALMARGSTPETVVRGSLARQSLPLESFGAQVQSAMADGVARVGR